MLGAGSGALQGNAVLATGHQHYEAPAAVEQSTWHASGRRLRQFSGLLRACSDFGPASGCSAAASSCPTHHTQTQQSA